LNIIILNGKFRFHPISTIIEVSIVYEQNETKTFVVVVNNPENKTPGIPRGISGERSPQSLESH
jgi:hypothetical protein